MSTHAPKRMFGCHLCSRKFSSASKLRLHRRCHLHGNGDAGLHGSRDGAGPSSTAGDKQEEQDSDAQRDEDEEEEEDPGCLAANWTLKKRRDGEKEKDGVPGMKRCREEVKEVEEEELPQRPRRTTVGPPIRYLLESEETSHDPGSVKQTNQEVANKHTPRRGGPKMAAGLGEAGGGSSDMTDRPEAEESSHMVAIGGREEESQRQRRPACPPIRCLLESEQTSHGSHTANRDTENKPTGRRGKPKNVSDLGQTGGGASEMIDRPEAEASLPDPASDKRKKMDGWVSDLNEVGGGASEMIDRCQAEGKETGHMVQKAREDEKEEQPQRRRRTVGPPIRYRLDSEETSHGLPTANQDAEQPTWRTGRLQKVSVHTPKRMFGCHLCNRKFSRAGKLLLHHRHHHHSNRHGLHGSRDGARPSSTRAADDKQEEQVKKKPLLTRPTEATNCSRDVKRVSKYPRWLLDYWTLKVRRRAAREKDEGRGPKRCREEEEEEEKDRHTLCVEKEQEPQRPRRTTVGPPIRYLLESEETSYSKEAANKQAERRQTSETVDDLSEPGGGASEAENKEAGHMVAIEGREREEEEPPRQRPRRTVGPPIRYLLEAEETSHGVGTVNQTNQEAANKHTGKRGRPKTAVGLSEAGGGASEMIDRPEAKGHMVQKARREDEQEEEPQRPMTTVGPPIRYLLSPEERSPNQDAENNPKQRTGSKQKASLHRPKRMFNCRLCNRKFNRAGKLLLHHRRHHSNRDGLQGNRDWAGPSGARAAADKQEEQDADARSDEEREERPRRTTVGPPIRYLLESEEMPGTANQSTAVKLVQRRGRPKKVIGGREAGGGASGMADSPEAAERQTGVHTDTPLVFRDLRHSQVTIISPCCVRMQRLL